MKFEEVDENRQLEILQNLATALNYYGNSDTWAHVRLDPDPPCGDIRYDWADMLGKEHPSPGQIARAAVSLAQGYGHTAGKADQKFMLKVGIDLDYRYSPPSPSPGDENYRETTSCCHLDTGIWKPRKITVENTEVCPNCHGPLLREKAGIKDYICQSRLYPCGHFIYRNPFGGSKRCEHLKAKLTEAAERA